MPLSVIQQPSDRLTRRNALLLANVRTLDHPDSTQRQALYHNIYHIYKRQMPPIGKGANGVCHLLTRDPNTVTDKNETFHHIPQSLVVKTANPLRYLPLHEDSIMRQLTLHGYPYFVKLYGTVYPKHQPHPEQIIMEYMNRGSLHEHLQQYAAERPEDDDELIQWRAKGSGNDIPEQMIWRIFLYLAKAALVAATGSDTVTQEPTSPVDWKDVIVHLDLNPRNVFVDTTTDQPRYVWGDFGSCVRIPLDWASTLKLEPECSSANIAFNSHWRPPEASAEDLRSIGHWTNTHLLGKTMWWVVELMPLPPRFHDDGSGTDEFYFDADLLDQHVRYSEDLRKTIKSCLTPDYKHRPTPQQLVIAIENIFLRNRWSIPRLHPHPQTILHPDLDQHTHRLIITARHSIQAITGRTFRLINNLPQSVQHASSGYTTVPDGLAYTPATTGMRAPIIPAPSSNAMALYQKGIDNKMPHRLQHVIVTISIWPRDSRLSKDTPQTTPDKISLVASHTASIADTKQHVNNEYSFKNPNKRQWILIFYPTHQKPLPNDLTLASLLPPSPAPSRLEQPDVKHIDTVNLDAIIIPDQQPLDDDDISELTGTSQTDPESPVNEHLPHHSVLRRRFASLDRKFCGVETLPLSFEQMIIVWPQTDDVRRPREAVQSAVPVYLWITNPHTCTVNHITTLLRSKYGSLLAIRSQDTVKIFDGGPVDGIHLGSSVHLDEQLIVANIVFSRERNCKGHLIHRHLDAVITRVSPENHKRPKTLQSS